MSRQSIGNQLKGARKGKGLSQTDIAEQLHIHRTVISRIETGVHQGSLQPLEQYAALLGYQLSLSPFSARPTLDELDDLYDD